MNTAEEALRRIAERNHPCARGHKTIRLFLNLKAMTKGRVKAQWWSRIPGATLFYESKPCATNAGAHRCSVCGGPTVPPSEPITIGGWYGDHHYTWDRGRPYLTSVKCARCRVRDDFTILEMGDGVLLPCRTMVAPNWGRYPTHQAAMDVLHAMALEEANRRCLRDTVNATDKHAADK